MARNSDSVKHSINLQPNDPIDLSQAGDLGADASDSGRLKYNTGTGAQRVLLAEDAFLPGFTDAENVQYDNSGSGLTGTDLQETTDELATLVDTAQAAADAAQADVDALESDVAANYAPLASPALTGTPTAPTATLGTDTTQIATTEFVQDAIAALPPPVTSASDVTFTPSGSISATNVQAAIEELDAEKQPLDATLTALAAYNTNGILTQTAADTFTGRTLTGTADQIAVTNGSGVSGNPTVGIATDPVLPGTGAVTVPNGTTAQRPGSPTDGMFRRNSDTGQFEGYTNGAWGAIAGSGGGAKNYITANDGSTTNGWAAYADAAGPAPVDGTGGSPTVTWTTTSSSPLAGLSSFLFTKDAANRQGEGVSYDFTIDAEDECSPSVIRCAVEVASGTYADGDLTFYVIDTTTGEVKQPSAYRVLNAVGPYKTQPAEFQLNRGMAYRLCIHVASTSASAYTVKFDTISLSPNTYSTGAIITDPVSYTPTITGAGTTTGVSAQWWREGAYLKAVVSFVAGTAAASRASLSLPASLSIDINKLARSNQTSVVGMGGSDGGSGFNSNGIIVLASPSTGTTEVYFGIQSGNLLNLGNGNQVFSTSGRHTFSLSVPILGWGTSQVLSSETDTRVVDFVGNKSATQSVTANVTDISFVTVKDSHGAWNGSQYTVRVPGDYWVSTVIEDNSTSSNRVSVYVNGSLLRNLSVGVNGAESSGSTIVTGLTAGSIISFRTNQTTTLANTCSASIMRLSGPAQVAASEKVSGLYTRGAANLANGGTAVYSTRVNDSHSAYNSSTGVLTAPRPGVLSISNTLQGSDSGGVGTACYTQLNVTRAAGGSETYTLHDFRVPIASSYGLMLQGSIELPVQTGDTMYISYTNGSAHTLTSAQGYFSFSMS